MIPEFSTGNLGFLVSLQRNKRIKSDRLAMRKYFQTEACNDAMVDAERIN